jgi:ubiquinone/menaquinone biosynthesis C-methylase UbiE
MANSPDQFTIYRQHADRYDELTRHEDYEHRLSPALAAIRSFDQVDVVEWGAGAGRVSELIAPFARSLIACDLNDHMLKVARTKLSRFANLAWRTVAAEHRHMPLPDHCADVALAGWTLGYFTSKFYAESWRQTIGQAIAQMQRVLRPGGTIIIIETLGTGNTEPEPPSEALATYYRLLEDDLGFQSTWLRTDFQFDSLDQAASTISFFFGESWAAEVRRNNWVILPECTGLWWKHLQ